MTSSGSSQRCSYAAESGNVALTARRFGISRQCFYIWKRAYEKHGEAGLINKSPCPVNMPLRMPAEIEEKILHLRRTYHFGPVRIAWYLERYHGLSDLEPAASTVPSAPRPLAPAGQLPQALDRQPALREAGARPPRPARREVPAVQGRGRAPPEALPVHGDRRRDPIRALRIYERHNQQSAIDFIDYVVERFPFRIHTIRTDNGHEWQAQFHWHVEDLGMRHVYIKPGEPESQRQGRALPPHRPARVLPAARLHRRRRSARQARRLGGVLQPAAAARGARRTDSLRGPQGEAGIVMTVNRGPGPQRPCSARDVPGRRTAETNGRWNCG